MGETRAGIGREAWIGALLVAAVFAVYAQTWGHAFVEFDDPLYVTENPVVRQGLTADGVLWAFTGADAYLFHPLTWLSYLLDVELWGVERAGPFALTNALLHAINTLLLFLLLRSWTHAFWASAFVAAIFGLHPLRVESVAWVSERKDVLSGFFFVATLWAYGRYAAVGGGRRYAAVLALLSLGLLAKPLLATLPVVLLLLDAWPLCRFGRVPLRSLLLEKLPLLLLCVAVAGAGVLLMDTAPNVWGSDPPLALRIAEAGVAYLFYLGKALWPTGLALVYPGPLQQGLAFYTGSTLLGTAALLGMLTAGALVMARRQPAIAVGWLWYLVVLLPMTGIVPFGIRVMNDRHTYLPMIGLAIALAFGVAPLLARRPAAGRVLAALGITAVLACGVASWRQVGIWRDSLTLFDHALAVTERNALIHAGKGVALAKAGASDAAQAEFRAALAIHPGHAGAHNSLGWLLYRAGSLEDAVHHYRRALELRPGYPLALVNLGSAELSRGDTAAAIGHLEAAIREAPRNADAHYWLGVAHEGAGRSDDAHGDFRAALAIDPEHVWSHARLARALELGGRAAEALVHYRAVLASRPDDPEALRGVAWILATAEDPALRDGAEALRTALRLSAAEQPTPTLVGYTLAAAHAEAGRFDDAVAVLTESLARLAPEERRWAPELRRCLALYAAGRRYEPPARARG